MKTIEEVENYLRSQKVSGVMAVRVRNLAKSFATIEAFFSAKKTDIEKMYNRITPDSKHGIGKGFWPIFNMALNYYNGTVADKDEEKYSSAEEDNANDDTILVRMHTYNELKSIVDMMEYCGIEAINFLEIAGFLENVRFRQKKTEDEKPEELANSGVESGKQ